MRRSPWAPALITLALAIAFLGVRYERGIDRDITKQVGADTTFADPALVPDGLYVDPAGGGYDGQFLYRFALDPTDLHVAAIHGIQLDSPLRSGRIGYPVLAWAVALGGQEGLVPWALVVVNVAGLAALGALGGVLARRAGRDVLWGLLLPGYFGFAFTLSRDLSEIVAAVATIGGLVLLMDRRRVAAGCALACAVLVREQALLTAALLTVGALVYDQLDPDDHTSVARRLVPLVIPAAAFTAWQLVGRAQTGEVPAFASSGTNFGPPFVGLFQSMQLWADGVRGAILHRRYTGLLDFVQLGAIVLVVGAAVAIGRRLARQHLELWFVLAGSVVLFCCLTFNVLNDPASFRTTYDVYLLAAVAVIVAAPRRLTLLAAALPVVWALTAWPLLKSA